MEGPDPSPSPEFSPLTFGEDLSPLPNYQAAGDTALDFSGLLSEPMRLHEDLTSGCGGRVWEAGMVLATHMLRYVGDRLHDSRMWVMFADMPRCRTRHVDVTEHRLELGAGGGLVGLAVARGCRPITPLVISDQVEMLSLMEHNIALNGLQDQARAMILNWYDRPASRIAPDRRGFHLPSVVVPPFQRRG